MKLTVTVNNRKFDVEYNAMKGVYGFTSKDDFYSVYIENERAIMRAVSRAEEDDTHKHTLTTKSGDEISVELFPTN